MTTPHEDALDPAGRAAWRDLARDLRAARRSESIRLSYLLALAQLRGRYPGTPLLAMTRDQICTFMIGLNESGMQPSSVWTKYRGLRRFYAWAAAEELIGASPMARVPEPALPGRLTPVLAEDQIRGLLAQCAGRGFGELRDTALIRLFCEAGSPRVAEMAGLTLADADMDGDVILIRCGKWSRDRLVPFGAVTGKALSKYLRARAARPDAARPQLWLGKKGAMTDSGIGQMLARRGRDAGLPRRLHAHQLRHTAYHRFDAAGASAQTAEKLFGWQPGSRMTRVYGAEAAGRRAVEHGRQLAIGDAL